MKIYVLFYVVMLHLLSGCFFQTRLDECSECWWIETMEPINSVTFTIGWSRGPLQKMMLQCQEDGSVVSGVWENILIGHETFLGKIVERFAGARSCFNFQNSCYGITSFKCTENNQSCRECGQGLIMVMVMLQVSFCDHSYHSSIHLIFKLCDLN